MNGHIVHGTSICVDYWQKTTQKKYLHFLTSLQAAHTVNLNTTFSEFIYTSPFNAWLVKRWFKIDPELVVSLPLDVPNIIYDESDQIYFSVTLMDANHCAGSVMFLFQGTFGNILYTGSFCYNPDTLKHPLLKLAIESDEVHMLYLDNTFAAEHCVFPSRQKALLEVIGLIRENLDHLILIGIRKLIHEELLQAIAADLEEKIYVSNERLKIQEHLRYGDVFTTDQDKTRIWATEVHHINRAYVHSLQEDYGPTLIILLSSANCVLQPDVRNTPKLTNIMKSVHHIPYGDHSCHSELVEFVSKLRPHTIHPIVNAKKGNKLCMDEQELKESSDFLVFTSFWSNSVIPHSILKFSKNQVDFEESLNDIPDLLVESLQENKDAFSATKDRSKSFSDLPKLESRIMFANHKPFFCENSPSVESQNPTYSLKNQSESRTHTDCLTNDSPMVSQEEYFSLSDEDLSQPLNAYRNPILKSSGNPTKPEINILNNTFDMKISKCETSTFSVNLKNATAHTPKVRFKISPISNLRTLSKSILKTPIPTKSSREDQNNMFRNGLFVKEGSIMCDRSKINIFPEDFLSSPNDLIKGPNHTLNTIYDHFCEPDINTTNNLSLSEKFSNTCDPDSNSFINPVANNNFKLSTSDMSDHEELPPLQGSWHREKRFHLNIVFPVNNKPQDFYSSFEIHYKNWKRNIHAQAAKKAKHIYAKELIGNHFLKR